MIFAIYKEHLNHNDFSFFNQRNAAGKSQLAALALGLKIIFSACDKKICPKGGKPPNGRLFLVSLTG